MYQDYSINDKIVFLQKMQKDMKFKQEILAKSFPADFVFLNNSQLEDDFKQLHKKMNNEIIKESLSSDEGMELIDSLINKSIELSQTNDKKIAAHLLNAQLGLIASEISELFKNTEFSNEISKIITTIASEAFLAGVQIVTELRATQDVHEITKNAVTTLINGENFQKSQNDLVQLFSSTALKSVANSFPAVLGNIISNISAPIEPKSKD